MCNLQNNVEKDGWKDAYKRPNYTPDILEGHHISEGNENGVLQL